MAINAYVGLMGSGKTYEVVENVILPALLSGRRVVTNVAGLQVDRINEYLIKKRNASPEKLGSICVVPHAQVLLKNFFPAELVEGATPAVPVESIVCGGDLVVIDECWRWWLTGTKITSEHMEFFRMHRHFVNTETLATCDIVLVVQSIGDLNRSIKAVVENVYRMTKLKALGFTKRYRVDVYAGHKISDSAKIRDMLRKYNSEIFNLYSSYSQSAAGGKEGAIDKRASIWRGPLFTVVLPLLVLMGAISYWAVYGFFHKKPPAISASASASSTENVAPVVGRSSAAPTSSNIDSSSESDWRIKGHYTLNGRHFVFLSRGDSERVLINPLGFFYDGFRVSGSLNGRILTNYTGSDSFHESGSSLTGSKK
jgi:zona occludens toxin